jgi:hypothetical protein
MKLSASRFSGPPLAGCGRSALGAQMTRYRENQLSFKAYR